MILIIQNYQKVKLKKLCIYACQEISSKEIKILGSKQGTHYDQKANNLNKKTRRWWHF